MSKADIDEVAQRVAVRAWRRLSTLGDPERAHEWITTVTRRECSRLRTEAQGPGAHCRDNASLDELPERTEPRGLADQNELTIRRRLHEAIARLPRTQRDVVTEFLALDRCNWGRLGGKLGVSDRGAAKRFQSAVQALRNRLRAADLPPADELEFGLGE